MVLVDTRSVGAEKLVEKLRRDLRNALQPLVPEITCSISAITFEYSVPMLQEAVSLADALMYQAKRQGKDQIVFRVATDSAIVPSGSDHGSRK